MDDVRYFSGYGADAGAYVRVLQIFGDLVSVEILVKVGNSPGNRFAPGNVLTVSANTLYQRREDASPNQKY